MGVLQLFLFNSCCRPVTSGEDSNRDSTGCCEETRPGAAQAAVGQIHLEAAVLLYIKQTPPVAEQAAIEQTRPETAQGCLRTDTSSGSTGLL